MFLKNCPLGDYVSLASIPLAVERSLECRILSQQVFEHPVLDVGCGDGLFALMLFGEKVDVGIDLDPHELDQARRCGIYGELIQCSADAVPRADGTFKTVFSNSVLEHVPELDPVLKEIYRLLAPGGRLYVTVPSDVFDRYTLVNWMLSGLRLNGPARAYRRCYASFWKHFHFYSLEQWRTLAGRAGFEVVDSFTYGTRRVCMLNDAMVPFCLPAFLMKKLTGRWILFPRLRKLLLRPITPRLESMVRKGGRCENGGLVFMALRKPLSTGARG